MKKLILPITILLIIGFVASMFTGLWEKPLPEMERMELPHGRVSLLLPKGAAAASPPESTVQRMRADYCFIQAWEAGQASEDFPETEIYLTRKNDGGIPVITRIRPDLVVYSNPGHTPNACALLKHPDGGLISIDIQFNSDVEKDADFCKRMREVILPSIQPGPAVRNLSERTETPDFPEAGICLEISVPQGFHTEGTYREEYDEDGNPVLYRQGLTIWWMRPNTRENNTFFMGIGIRKDAPGEDTLSTDLTKREGVLLGQKMEWSIGQRGERMVMVNGSIPYGPKGWHIGVSCLCPEEDLPIFFSLVEKIKPTKTQP